MFCKATIATETRVMHLPPLSGNTQRTGNSVKETALAHKNKAQIELSGEKCASSSRQQ